MSSGTNSPLLIADGSNSPVLIPDDDDTTDDDITEGGDVTEDDDVTEDERGDGGSTTDELTEPEGSEVCTEYLAYCDAPPG